MLATYNSLCDEHLATYNSNPRNLKHLRKMGLITLDKVILDDNLVRVNLARRQQVRKSNILLADTVVSKAIENERKRRCEIKQRMNFLAKIEKVEKVKGMRHHPIGIQEFDPYDTLVIPPRISTAVYYRTLAMCEDQLSTFVGPVKTRVIPACTQSPYLNNSVLRKSLGMTAVMPRPPSVPPPLPSQMHGGTSRKSSRIRRPCTAPVQVTCPMVAPRLDQIHSNVKITLCFVGKSINLSGYRSHQSSQVIVLQQHCGGNTVTLYKGSLSPKDNFQFLSRRHYGNPFGLSIYLDGIIETRVSSCCEYRHSCGKMLGSTIAQFKLVSVEGGKPCYRCMDEREGHPRFSVRASSVGVRALHELKQGKLENVPRKQSAKRKDPSLFEESHTLFAEDGPAIDKPSGPAIDKLSGPAIDKPSGPAIDKPSGPAIDKLEIMSRSQSRDTVVAAAADDEYSSIENDDFSNGSEDTLPLMEDDNQTLASSSYERPKTVREIRGMLPNKYHSYRTERPTTARAVSRNDKKIYEDDEQSTEEMSSDNKISLEEYSSLEENDSSLKPPEDNFTSEDEPIEKEVKTREKTSEEELASDDTVEEKPPPTRPQHEEDDELPDRISSDEIVEKKLQHLRPQHKEEDESPEEELASEAQTVEEKPPSPQPQQEDDESQEEELISEEQSLGEKPPPLRPQHKQLSHKELSEEDLTSEAETVEEKLPPPRPHHKEDDESPEDELSEDESLREKPPPIRPQHKEDDDDETSEEELASEAEKVEEKLTPQLQHKEDDESPEEELISEDESLREKSPSIQPQHKEDDDDEMSEEELASEAETVQEKLTPPQPQHKEDDESPEEELISEDESLREKSPSIRAQHKEDDDETPEEELASEVETVEEKLTPPQPQHKEDDSPEQELISEDELLNEKPPSIRSQHKVNHESLAEEFASSESETPQPQHKEDNEDDESPEEKLVSEEPVEEKEDKSSSEEEPSSESLKKKSQAQEDGFASDVSSADKRTLHTDINTDREVNQSEMSLSREPSITSNEPPNTEFDTLADVVESAEDELSLHQ